MESLPTNWNLQRYFYTSIEDEQIKTDIEEYKTHVEEYVIKKYKNTLRNLDSYEEWKNFFYDFHEHPSNKKIISVLLYLHYSQALDTQNQEVIKKIATVENMLREFQEQLLFIDEEFKAIGKQKLYALSKREDLQAFSKFFKDKADTLQYELSNEVEKSLLIKSRGSARACNVDLFDELTNSLEFKFIDDNGEEKMLTQEELLSYLHSKNRDIRKQVSTSLSNVYLDQKLQITFGNIYSSIVKDSVSSMRLRGFETVLSEQNKNEDLDDESVEMLLVEVKKRFYPLYQKYLQLKKKYLNLDSLMPWDLQAPIGEMRQSFDFNRGSSLFLNTIKSVDSEMYEYSKKLFDEQRCDVFAKKGKTGGAFCSFYKDFDSFVLLNYTSNLDDVFTIAHEFGHAYHGEKLQNQPQRYYETPLCLAETASVFNELLLSHSLLEELEYEEKLYVLNEQLNGFFATICRQITYTLFEKKIHESFANNNDLTYEDFNVAFREEQKRLYGGVVEFPTEPQKDFTWSRIPHIFHTPFYCYSYAFGQIVSIYFYKQYLDKGESFMNSYKEFLSAGSSQKPKDLLYTLGIDINSQEFYEKAESFIKEKLEEFETMIN